MFERDGTAPVYGNYGGEETAAISLARRLVGRAPRRGQTLAADLSVAGSLVVSTQRLAQGWPSNGAGS
jgi:hypothetical protein